MTIKTLVSILIFTLLIFTPHLNPLLPISKTSSLIDTQRTIASEPSTNTDEASREKILQFFKSRKKKVVTFIGYSGAQYEDKNAMLKIAKSILAKLDPKTTIINIGATSDGIGEVYKVAKAMGFETSGIVSTQVKKYGGLSPHVDNTFFVRDETWGGFKNGTSVLSPTSQAMLDVSDEVVGIGGGEFGRDELIAARRANKPVQFFQAEMNHKIAIEKAIKVGAPQPTDFNGAASRALRRATLTVSTARSKCVTRALSALVHAN